MAYRLRYQVWVDWVPQGMGLGIEQGTSGPGPLTAGNAQTIAFFNSQSGVTTAPGVAISTTAGAVLPPNSSTFLNTDVANLLGAMGQDLSAQMNVAAVLTRIQNFSTGTG